MPMLDSMRNVENILCQKTERSNRLLAAQTGLGGPGILLDPIVFPSLSVNAPDQLVSGVLSGSEILVHLHSLSASVNQKTSMAEKPKFVRCGGDPESVDKGREGSGHARA